MQLSIRYSRAAVIGVEYRLWSKWIDKARENGVLESTIKAVMVDWFEGKVSLLIDAEEWVEIQ